MSPSIQKTASAGNFSRIALLIVIAVSVYIRVHGANAYYYNPDEALHVNIAGAETLSKLLQYSRYEVHPPAFYILCHYWMKISSDPAFMRGLSLVFAVASIVLYYRIGELLNGEFTGLYCAILIAFCPGCIVQSYLVRQYMVFLFFISLAFYFYLIWKNSLRTGALLAYGCFGLLGCLTHFSGILTIACIACDGMLSLRKREAVLRPGICWIIINAVIAAITIAVYIFWKPVLASLYPLSDAAAFREFSSATVRMIHALSYPFEESSYLLPRNMGILGILALSLAALFSLPAFGLVTGRLYSFLGLSWIALVAGMAALFTGIYPHVGTRQSLWVVPLLLPATAWILTECAEKLVTHLSRPSLAPVFMHTILTAFFAAACMTYDAQARFADTREYVLSQEQWNALETYFQTLGPRDVIVTEKDDGTSLANLYPFMGDVPFMKPSLSTQAALLPFANTHILFNPYYARSYSQAALYNTLSAADARGWLKDTDRIVFFRTLWSFSPLAGLMTCAGAEKKVITFPALNPSHDITQDDIYKSPASLMVVSRKTMTAAVRSYLAGTKGCPKTPL